MYKSCGSECLERKQSDISSTPEEHKESLFVVLAGNKIRILML